MWLKFNAGLCFAKNHSMSYLVWTEDFLFNTNGVTTELTEETLSATAAVLRNGRIMIQSDPCGDTGRQDENTCPPMEVLNV